MKYTARDESRVAILSQDSHQELYTFIQTSGSVLSVYCILY